MPDAGDEPLPPKWQVLATTTLVHDRWLRLDRETVRMASGHVIEELVSGAQHPWTCAVATVPDGRVITLEQYRRGPDAWVVEIPAGNIEPLEAPAACAVRELREESGFAAISDPVPLEALVAKPAHNTACAHGLVRVAPSPVRRPWT